MSDIELATTTARIGTSDLEVRRLGLGGNTFGMTSDAAESFAVLDAFVAGGGSLIDTADSYSSWVPGNSGGESETILGEWLRARGSRDDVVLATKVSGHPDFPGLAPENIARAADASLRRLQTDHIDLYYAHHDDASTPLVDTLAAFDALVRAGKVRYLGISNYGPDRIAEWMSVAQDNGFDLPVALQPHYNLVHRQTYERTLASLAVTHDLGVFPYFSLAGGFLTGKYRTAEDAQGVVRGSAVGPYLTTEGLGVVNTLGEVAAAHHAPLATTALAWLLAKPTVTAPLASATSPAQLGDLLAAVELTLTRDEVALLDDASQAFA